jgi:hypothetical protein
MNTKETTYNGWTNYATWRVNLELFEGFELEDELYNLSTYDFSEYLKELAEEFTICNCENEIAKDYALAFLHQVNYYEIAQFIKEYRNETNL